MGLALALSFANYGAMATTAVHSHDHDGFHQVHAIVDSGHDHHDADDEQGAPGAGNAADRSEPAPEHTETGLHSHSTPQFGPQEYALTFAVGDQSLRLTPADPGGLRHLCRDHPPYKPPRAIL